MHQLIIQQNSLTVYQLWGKYTSNFKMYDVVIKAEPNGMKFVLTPGQPTTEDIFCLQGSHVTDQKTYDHKPYQCSKTIMSASPQMHWSEISIFKNTHQ